jgi:hypothetical protein
MVRRIMLTRLAAVPIFVLAMALSACGSGNSDVVAVGSTPDDLGVATTQPIARGEVGDSDGLVHGAIDPAEKSARLHRVVDAAIAGGYINPEDEPGPKAKQQIMDALYVLDPLEVRDAEGNLTGYFTTRFVGIDDYPAEREASEAMLKQLRP